MSRKKRLLLTVVGPTAIGKTRLAIALAQHFGTEIISCDSRQFFREMRIGTAVPTAEEQTLIKHHFIQHKSIFEPYSEILSVIPLPLSITFLKHTRW